MSLISDEKIAKLAVWRKYILRVAIWLLIAGVVAGVVLILVNDTKEIAEVISKTMGNIFLVAAMMVVSVLCFHLIESKKSVVQIFATIGLWTSLAWVVLWSLAIWAWEPLFMTVTRDPEICAQYIERENQYAERYGYEKITECPEYVGAIEWKQTILLKLTLVITILSVYSLIAALMMNLYEGKRKDLIRPLKIVSTVLAGYVAFYLCLMVLMEWPSGFDKMGALAGFAASIWFVVMIVAWVISHNEKTRDGIGRKTKKGEEKKVEAGEGEMLEETASEAVTETAEESVNETAEELPVITMPRRKTDEELRAEIEEQVRREMIEKQVREKLEKEMEENGHL